MYGMDPDPELEKTLRKAVDLITKAQSPSGGWRYQPNPGDQDLSVTVMQIVALRVANNAEIPVPAAVIDKAIGYVRSSGDSKGGYGYTAGAGPRPPSGVRAMPKNLVHRIDLAKQAIRFRLDASDQLRRGVIS